MTKNYIYNITKEKPFMLLSRIVWNQLRHFGRIKFFYKMFYLFFRLSLKNGKIQKIAFGPLRGNKWKHYNCFQPWMAIGIYEPEVTGFLFKKLNGSDGFFFDIGANAGYYTLLSAKIMSEKGRVACFEPIPFNIKAITEQLTLNALNNKCKIEQYAVSDFSSNAELTIPEKNANAYLSSIEVSHFKTSIIQEKITVKCITLDDYVEKHGMPTLIKMDIEGAEVNALKGAQRILQSADAPEIMLTAHSTQLFEDCIKIFKENNFTTIQIGGNIFAKKGC